MELLLEKVRMLDRLGHPDEVDAVMREIVQCERGDAESLAKLIDWLVKRKAWPIVDEVAARFAATIELDAVLLYSLSEARCAADNNALAEETADKALKLGGDNPLEHLEVAKRLLERGLTEWSDRELSHVIALGPPASPAAIQARLLQSDSLHDRLRDHEAGQRIKELMDLLDGDANVQQQVKLLLQQSDKTIDFLRARMYFYFACAAGAEKKVDEQRDFLDKAIDEEPGDLDVIIALHKLKDDDPNRKQRIANLIKSMVDDCREKMEEFPDDPVYYNELAWLVANTEGDVDEAIRLSHKSVELVRRSHLRRGLQTAGAISRHAGALLFCQARLCRGGEISNRGRQARSAYPCDRSATRSVSRRWHRLAHRPPLPSSRNRMDMTNANASNDLPSMVRAGDVELAVVERGTGMPLLLVHGFPLDHSMWNAQIEALGRQWRAIAPDLRGFGASQVTPGTGSMEQMADDLAALLDTLQVTEPVVLIGLSMGGYVAFQFLRRHAHRLRALVLCDTRAVPDTAEGAAGRHKLAAQVLEQGAAPVADAMLPKLFGPQCASPIPMWSQPRVA